MASVSIMAEELGERTKKELKAVARNAGVSDDAIDDAGEGEDEKAALIELIVAASARPAAAQKRAALAEKSKKELKAEARQAGVSTDAIDDAGEAEDEKAALIDLILTAGATGSGELGEERRAMLAEKTKKELKAEARQAGVLDDAIDDAGETEDGTAALINLIMSAELVGTPAPGFPMRRGVTVIEIGEGITVTLGKQIGKGGNGVVFRGTLAEDGHSQEVAVKTIADGAQSHELASFKKELKTLSRIAQRCDGVCKMFGSAEHDGRLYLVMKLYDGSLDAHLRQTGPLDPLKVIEFGLQLAHTVRTAAHMMTSFAKT